jgi:hypothetical protein
MFPDSSKVLSMAVYLGGNFIITTTTTTTITFHEMLHLN